MKKVEISWLDTVADSGWKSEEYKGNPKDMLQHSVGYLLENSKSRLLSVNREENI